MTPRSPTDPKTWIQTYTGKQFFPLNPSPQDLDIRDIAHALSLQCRFNGHCLQFYSVAEHSVRVADWLGGELQLWGLLHDAAEAYLGDVVRPLKGQLDTYNEIETGLLRVVADHFGLSWPMPEEVAVADTRLLAAEARDIMAPPPAPWELMGLEPLPVTIEPWSATEAERRFLDRYSELSGA